MMMLFPNTLHTQHKYEELRMPWVQDNITTNQNHQNQSTNQSPPIDQSQF